MELEKLVNARDAMLEVYRGVNSEDQEELITAMLYLECMIRELAE